LVETFQWFKRGVGTKLESKAFLEQKLEIVVRWSVSQQVSWIALGWILCSWLKDFRETLGYCE